MFAARDRRPVRSALAVATVALAVTASAGGAAAAAPSSRPAAPDLGSNVLVFDPGMPVSDIQAAVDAVAAQQVPNQFGDQRYALLFKPGSYGTAEHPLVFDVGYYTEVAGLGAAPTDVTINGRIEVHDQCFPTAPGDPTDCTALDNFWRSMSNLTISIPPVTDCASSAEFWAVSQAAPLRRVNVLGGNVSLQDYCSAGPQYASGGFIADSAFAGGTVINGSQQQFLVRNSNLDGWTNGVWNQVFAGTIGAPAQSYPDPPYTTLDTTPVSREKPYLTIDGQGHYSVFVPSAQPSSRGTSWQQGQTPGKSIPIEKFFVAKPSDSIGTIDTALQQGKNLILTPGVYRLSKPINVFRPDTVVLGLGLATVQPTNGGIAMRTADVPGIDIAGIMFDAGPKNSPVLLRLGTALSHLDGRRPRPFFSRADDPTALQDVFFRIGGAGAGKATTALVVNTNQTVLDDIWAWRADHGTGVGWTVNTSDTGLIVNGNDVTATGLFAEHFQKYDVIWNGERGRTVMFQNEMPYDPPNQAAWQHDGVDGWAAYKVADSVRTHEGWGLGSYIYTNLVPTLHASRAFEVPVTPGVRLHDLLTISLNKAGTIDHVVNDTGGPVTPTIQGPSSVVSFP